MNDNRDLGRSTAPRSGSGQQPSASAVPASQSAVPNAFEALKAAIAADPEYAWAWHCNIAVPIMDATGISHKAANEAAAFVMLTLFGCDITTNRHYQYGKSGAQEYFEMRVAAEREEDHPHV